MKIGDFRIPPFTLAEGELKVLQVGGGAHFQNLNRSLIEIFSGLKKHERVEVGEKLKSLESIELTGLSAYFFPPTVGQYLKKTANSNSELSERIYKLDHVNSKTKISSLAGTPRKLLSVYSVLSHTNKIIFDLAGLDPKGAAEVFQVVQKSVEKGGAGILVDCFEDMKNKATEFLEIEAINKGT